MFSLLWLFTLSEITELPQPGTLLLRALLFSPGMTQYQISTELMSSPPSSPLSEVIIPMKPTLTQFKTATCPPHSHIPNSLHPALLFLLPKHLASAETPCTPFAYHICRCYLPLPGWGCMKEGFCLLCSLPQTSVLEQGTGVHLSK